MCHCQNMLHEKKVKKSLLFNLECNYENRAFTSSTFRLKPKALNRDELAANTSRPICIVGVELNLR